MIRNHIAGSGPGTPRRVRAAAVALVLLATVACTPDSSSAADRTATAASRPAAAAPAPAEPFAWDQQPTTAAAARQLLAGLAVEAEDANARYDPDDWAGPGWASRPDGCNVRERVLTAQALPGTTQLGKGCKPLCPAQSCWISPYDGVAVRDPGKLDIDHIVPVAQAARSGARRWDEKHQRAYYNDPRNLAAVTAHANRSKSDQDPARWKPPNAAAWCVYARAYVDVKATYGLSVDVPERQALEAMLSHCP